MSKTMRIAQRKYRGRERHVIESLENRTPLRTSNYKWHVIWYGDSEHEAREAHAKILSDAKALDGAL